MQVKNYTHIATIRIIDNQVIFKVTQINHYYAIFYMYPTRTQIITYKNLIEARQDLVKRIQFLAKTYKVEFTEKDEKFVSEPDSILL